MTAFNLEGTLKIFKQALIKWPYLRQATVKYLGIPVVLHPLSFVNFGDLPLSLPLGFCYDFEFESTKDLNKT